MDALPRRNREHTRASLRRTIVWCRSAQKGSMRTIARGTITFTDGDRMAFEIKSIEGKWVVYDQHGYGSDIDQKKMQSQDKTIMEVVGEFCEMRAGRRGDLFTVEFFDPVGGTTHANTGVLNVPPPTAKEMATTFAKASANWFKAGMPVRSAEEVDRIFTEVCRPCRYYKGNEESGRCLFCGCNIKRKTGLVNKIKMATESCPKGKW